MPRYVVMATEYIYKDVYIDAKDAEEAIAKAEEDNVDWVTVAGDFEIHDDMTFEEIEDGQAETEND